MSTDLGSGVYQSAKDGSDLINYNLFLSVNHPEWAYRWAKYALPTLPESDHAAVLPYIQKHRALWQKHNVQAALALL